MDASSRYYIANLKIILEITTLQLALYICYFPIEESERAPNASLSILSTSNRKPAVDRRIRWQVDVHNTRGFFALDIVSLSLIWVSSGELGREPRLWRQGGSFSSSTTIALWARIARDSGVCLPSSAKSG